MPTLLKPPLGTKEAVSEVEIGTSQVVLNSALWGGGPEEPSCPQCGLPGQKGPVLGPLGRTMGTQDPSPCRSPSILSPGFSSGLVQGDMGS